MMPTQLYILMCHLRYWQAQEKKLPKKTKKQQIHELVFQHHFDTGCSYFNNNIQVEKR